MTDAASTPFADRLQAALDAMDITQAKLAELVDVSPPTVFRWLNGTIPERATGRYLAARLGVSWEWLLNGRNETTMNPLQQAREAAGVSIKELAKRTNYAIGVLQAVEQGARASEKMIEAIAKVLPKFDAEKALSGSETPPVLDATGMNGTYGMKPRVALPPGITGRYVPLLSFAQAGRYQLDAVDEGWTGESWLSGVDSKEQFALRIEGDSMMPVLAPGDIVVVAKDWSLKRGEEVVVKMLDGEVLCKVWGGEKDGVAILMSHNPLHMELRVPRDHVAWVYPVAQTTRIKRRP